MFWCLVMLVWFFVKWIGGILKLIVVFWGIMVGLVGVCVNGCKYLLVIYFFFVFLFRMILILSYFLGVLVIFLILVFWLSEVILVVEVMIGWFWKLSLEVVIICDGWVSGVVSEWIVVVVVLVGFGKGCRYWLVIYFFIMCLFRMVWIFVYFGWVFFSRVIGVFCGSV